MRKSSLFKVAILLFLLPSVIFSCKKDDGAIPTLDDVYIIELTHNHAVAIGGVEDTKHSGITSMGVCWSTSPNPTFADKRTSDYFIFPGCFYSYFNGLSQNTTYYLRAYANNSTGTGYSNQTKFTTYSDFSGQTGTVADIEGNIYKTIGIGNQIWMAENLMTTKFNDGSNIPDGSDNALWFKLYSPGYCFYDNDLNNKATYGLLYNWYTVNISTNGDKNVCPTGWHVPDNNDWKTLTGFLGETATGKWTDSTSIVEGCKVAGKLLKESGTLNWLSGNSGTDDFGFSAFPGGFRSQNGAFAQIAMDGFWWSSTEKIGSFNEDNKGSYVSASYIDNDGFYLLGKDKRCGLSVRCIANSQTKVYQ